MRNERGVVLVWVTLMIVILLVMVGMGLDTGQLVYSRATGQGAVDAAALSAASALPSGIPSEVESRAAAFIGTNDYVGSSGNPIGSGNVSYVQYDFSSGAIAYNVPIGVANGVRVALEGGDAISTPSFLMPLMRLFGASAPSSHNVNVSAVAVISGKPSIPIALWDTECAGSNTRTDVEIRVQPPGDENSCWTTYLDKSSGANDIRDRFDASGTCSGIPEGFIDVGVPIYENKGTVQTIFGSAKNLFAKNPGGCWNIPVIKGGTNCNQKNPTPILDWAKMCPSEVFEKGAHSYIKANVTCKQSLSGSKDSLCFSHRLVREPGKGY